MPYVRGDGTTVPVRKIATSDPRPAAKRWGLFAAARDDGKLAPPAPQAAHVECTGEKPRTLAM